MKVSIEILYHCRCDSCGAWWSIADREPKEQLTCPECSYVNSMDGFSNGKSENVLGVSWLGLNQCPK